METATSCRNTEYCLTGSTMPHYLNHHILLHNECMDTASGGKIDTHRMRAHLHYACHGQPRYQSVINFHIHSLV